MLSPLGLFLLLPLLAQAAPLHTQASAATPAPALTPGEAQALVSRALGAELRSAQDPGHPMRYRLRKSSPRLTSTKEIYETHDGFVARLVAINDRPLSPAEEQKEEARLDALASDPSLQRHRKQSEDADTGRAMKILRALPQAFLYQFAGTAAGPGGKVVKFTFRPDPRFDPPDLETQALTTMTGELWIDAAQERVTRLEGHLEQDTNYAWGILGKLNKGGSVIIEQVDVGGRQWRIARVQMQMNLRILFKTKNIDTTEEMTEYTPAPSGIDYRQAIQMLRNPAQPGH
jgi:hypothetical protein